MDIVKLSARSRTGSGKSYTRKARVQGWIPAVYYGHNRETKSIEISGRDFSRLVRTKQTNRLIDLGLAEDSGDSISVIKEMQRDVLKDDIFYHIDFQHVAMNEKISVECLIHIEGIPVGVREESGILEHPVRRVSIECLPMNIPDFITVDVSALNIGDSIHVRDLSVPDVVIKNAPDEVIAVVSSPMKEEAAAATVTEGAVATTTAVADGASATPAAAAAGAGADKKDKGAKGGKEKG